MNELYKPKFSGLKLCKLTGITHTQFQSFKQAGLIENKYKYSLQDVIYVGFSNSFRLLNLNWLSVIKIYNKIFNGVENVKNFDFLKYSALSIDMLKEEFYMVIKDDINVKKLDKLEYDMFLCQKTGIKQHVILKDVKSFFIKSNNQDGDYYFIFIYKIVEEIIKRSKELDLKVNVEKILLSA